MSVMAQVYSLSQFFSPGYRLSLMGPSNEKLGRLEKQVCFAAEETED